MRTEAEFKAAAANTLCRLLRGERVITNDEVLTAIGRNDVASCFNARRCGVLDQYVAWIGDDNKPADLREIPGTYLVVGSV